MYMLSNMFRYVFKSKLNILHDSRMDLKLERHAGEHFRLLLYASNLLNQVVFYCIYKIMTSDCQ